MAFSAGATAATGLSTGATLGIAAGVIAAEEIIRHYVGRGRKSADAWVKGGNGQNDFLKNVLEPAAEIAKTDPAKASALTEEAWKTYLQGADEYASKGKYQSQAVMQNLLKTPDFMNTVASLLGKDPLSAEFTSGYLPGKTDQGLFQAPKYSLGSILANAAKTAVGIQPSAGQTSLGLPAPTRSTSSPTPGSSLLNPPPLGNSLMPQTGQSGSVGWLGPTTGIPQWAGPLASLAGTIINGTRTTASPTLPGGTQSGGGTSGGAPTGGGPMGSGTGNTGGTNGTGGTQSSLLGNLAQAGIQAGSALLGSKLGGGVGGLTGGSTGTDTNGLLKEQIAGMQQLRSTASGLQPTANDLLRQSSAAYAPVISHYNALLSGNRGAAMSELSPEVQRINQGYDAASRNAAALMPRGGGRTAFNSELPYEHMRDVNNLLLTSRSTGAQGLLQAGSAAGGQGANLYSSILSGLSGAQSGGNSLLTYDLQAKAEQAKKNQALGQQIYGVLGPLLGKITGGKGSTSSGGGYGGGIDPNNSMVIH